MYAVLVNVEVKMTWSEVVNPTLQSTVAELVLQKEGLIQTSAAAAAVAVGQVQFLLNRSNYHNHPLSLMLNWY